jgi:hypothetical protein
MTNVESSGRIRRRNKSSSKMKTPSSSFSSDMTRKICRKLGIKYAI